MRLIISTVSHNHSDMIIAMDSLRQATQMNDVIVICRDNVGQEALSQYCQQTGITYIANGDKKGFATNNNLNYLHYLSTLEPQPDDYFLLLNPDVQITTEALENLRQFIIASGNEMVAGNLYLDAEEHVEDDNIRRFPKLWSFISAYAMNDRSTVIRKADIPNVQSPLWASGALIAVKATVYQQLGGLDEKYYMYCEDIDFCYRAYQAGYKIAFSEETKAIHWRQRASRKLLSRYFFWHAFSALRFCLARKKIRSKQSQLYQADNLNLT